jgi:hypothetical protein
MDSVINDVADELRPVYEDVYFMKTESYRQLQTEQCDISLT